MRTLMIENLLKMLADFHRQAMRWDNIRVSFYQQVHADDTTVNSKKGMRRVDAWVPCKEDFEKLSDVELFEVYNRIHRRFFAQY